MTQLAHTFTRTLTRANKLNPTAIRTTIHNTRDDGLKAASYDGPTARSASVSSHPERMALTDRPDRTDADLSLVDEHVDRYIDSIHSLAVRSHSGPYPVNWRAATVVHAILIQIDAIAVLENTGQKPARWVHQAGDAIHDLELIAGRHMPRIPDDFDKLLAGDAVCLSHARIGDYERSRHGKLDVCKTCYDLLAAIGTPGELHRDPDHWPPTALLREHAEMERTGKRTDYQRARTDWIANYPIRRGA